MNPTPSPVNWTYPALMGAAIGTGVLVSWLTRRPMGLSVWERLALGVAAFCGGMLGAKLPFVVLNIPGLLSGSAWFDSGKTIVFGLVGGYFGVEIGKWALHIRVKTGDGFAAPVAASVAIGRLACFSAGCCYGTVTDLPWGVDFAGDGICRHPTQIYEFAFHITCAMILAWMHSAGQFRGQLMKLYIIVYLIYRFATEFIRPEPKSFLDLSVYQWAAMLFVPVFVLLWVIDARALARIEKGPGNVGPVSNRP